MIKVKVTGRTDCAEDMLWLELSPIDGTVLPAFTAGAHIDLHLANGMVRQYSLCNDPAERHRYCLGILKEPRSRGGSRYVHEALRIGAVLSVGLPRNLFSLREDAPGALLFAGGIGITPLMAMAQRLMAIGRPFSFHYCVREVSRAVLPDGFPVDRVHLHVDTDPSTRLNLEGVLSSAPRDHHLYICGPAGFIDHVRKGALNAGWSPAQIHSESFQAATPQAGTTRSFDIVIARSGRRISVGPEQTAAEALLAAGIEVPLSCEQGVCGTCLTPVIAGEVDHRDLVQSQTDRQRTTMIALCCSRALSPEIIIDI